MPQLEEPLAGEYLCCPFLMFWGSWIIFLFLILHLLQFTDSRHNNRPPMQLDAQGIVLTFSHWWFVLIYLHPP